MNIKLALGIILPLLLIVFLVILSAAGIGFSTVAQTVDSVSFDSLFIDKGAPRTGVPIQTITVTNDFFLAKRYVLPMMAVCLGDKAGLKQRENMNVRYSEGTYSRGSSTPFFDDVFFSYRPGAKQTIELPANSKKQIRILVDPRILYNVDQARLYAGHDELLLVEQKESTKYRYVACQNLQSEQIESAVRISVLK